jgi:hypothetical protein
MFFHSSGLRFEAEPDGPDPVYARKTREILGGAWGEVAAVSDPEPTTGEPVPIPDPRLYGTPVSSNAGRSFA